MSQLRVHHNQNRNRVRIGGEEEKAWRGFYRDAGNPDVAEEIIKELNADEEMKRAHLALYMSCKQTLRINKSRQARNRRVGQFVRWLAGKLCVAPWRFIFGWMRRGRDVAVECLPEVRKEPAEHKVEHLGKEREFAQAKATFDATEAKFESGTKSTNDMNSTNGANSTNGEKRSRAQRTRLLHLQASLRLAVNAICAMTVTLRVAVVVPVTDSCCLSPVCIPKPRTRHERN